MIRNFPHQINRLAKIHLALALATEIIQNDENVSDDGIYGYALARRKIFTFRGLADATVSELEERISEEQTKLQSNQGPRTFARDIRRTLLLLNFLNRHNSTYSTSETGRQILDLPPLPNPETQEIWINAVLGIELNETPGLSIIHPAQNMLKIIASVPSVEKRWLAFALGMRNDTLDELNRIEGMIEEGNFDQARESEQASEYKAANAVKILPALLQQLELIKIESSRCNLTHFGRILISRLGLIDIAGLSVSSTVIARPRIRAPQPGSNIEGIADIRVPEDGPRNTSHERRVQDSQLIDERTRQHQMTLRLLVENLQNLTNLRSSENAFDLLGESELEPVLLLFEAKTLRHDILRQVRQAAGQLIFYEYFDVIPIAGERRIIKIAVFDNEPGEEARGFLSHYGIYCVTISEESLIVPDEIRQYFTQ